MPGLFALPTRNSQPVNSQPLVDCPPVAAANARTAAVFTTSLLLIAILIATVVAYAPVLFNFFAGDDFVHLTWLKEALKNPELIWRNFHSSWLDGTTTRFYRPLISVFMVSDYLLWKTNGLGFHITNLIFHLTSSMLLFLVVRNLEDSSGLKTESQPGWWAISAAALFALYPLHPEAVSWITGRVDAIVTTFCLASLWAYISWRRRGNPLWLVLATTGMILGLLSKEMAVTLPVVFFAYDLIIATGSRPTSAGESAELASRAGPVPVVGDTGSNLLTELRCRIINAAQGTAWFWAILSGYFVVRRIALGTFVGGYDDSLFFIANLHGFVSNWIHGLRMLFMPINHELIGMHHPLYKLWVVVLAGNVCLASWSVLKTPRLRAPVLFVLVWLGLSLVPVYKIFTIGDDLQGSRLAYVATVPLCVLLTAGFSILSRRSSMVTWLMAIFGTALIAGAGCILWVNNQAWSHAGQTSNAIRAELGRLYKEVPGDPQVLIIGLPDQIQGAYVSRNALWGMTKDPQMFRDVSNCLMINGFEPILPFGFLKESLQAAWKQVKVYRWDAHRQALIAVPLPTEAASNSNVWNGQLLKQVLNTTILPGVQMSWQTDGSLEIKPQKTARQRPELLLHIQSPCWTTDFIAVKVRLLDTGSTANKVGADLLYTNDLNPAFALERRTHCDLQPAVTDQSLIFPLRSMPDWALGGHSHQLKLLLPPACHLLIESVSTVKSDSIMPAIEFNNSGYLGTKGFVHLSQTRNQAEIHVRLKGIKDAQGYLFEITRTNQTFENQNSQQVSSVIMHTLGSTTSDTILLHRTLFPTAGMYEGRAWAVDKNGQRIGVAGDHIVISVDS